MFEMGAWSCKEGKVGNWQREQATRIALARLHLWHRLELTFSKRGVQLNVTVTKLAEMLEWLC